MRVAALFFVLFLFADPPRIAVPAIPYFTNVRDVHVADPNRQNFFIVDNEIWNHARLDLGDLRLYDGNAPVQYAISEQREGMSSEQIEAKILNLGSVAGHTEFDVDTGGLPEYDRIRLQLDAHDFVATASVSGGSAPGKAQQVMLTPSTLYDFSKEQLGSNSLLKIPTSSFRYLHIRLTPGIKPAQVKGATLYDLHEQKARWSRTGTCAAAEQKERSTVILCDIPAKAPLDRIAFQIAPAQVNFRRTVSVQNAHGVQIASGEISRVRINRGGTLVTAEDLSVNVYGNYGPLTLDIDNGENPPLTITAVEPLALERRIYFDAEGRTNLRLYYGDEELASPTYDYARFFHLDPAAVEAQLEPGSHNAQYTGRPDGRPWSEKHKGVLWAAMLVAVVGLAALAIRGLRTSNAQ
jgi:hypothetical protein